MENDANPNPALIQPMDQNVIQNIKLGYRKLLLTTILNDPLHNENLEKNTDKTQNIQVTRHDREQHHNTSTQTRMTERHHGKKMALVAPRTIERRRQLIVTATLHRFNIVSSPNCEFCVHAEETISHILFHCPRYRDPRLQLLKEIQDLNPVYSDASLQSLLNLDTNAKIKPRALEKFFPSCNSF
ncbi:hypothetical protein AVEN_121034-2 [Araneus ventricosus]|uniref:Reverse transcriptase zinc-binding domain-containing protein n=1 Tax=Araneus ventricosus TaxID=182803 RepID=A0A4Y2F3A0_ARAVE|nr:hypothetical protein AVEN_121034-2 [Araneus ventricosus]